MLLQFDRVDSTNTVAWNLIDRGWGDGTIVIARSQTQGRGQRGRTWSSERGGLYLSMIYIPGIALTDPSLITMGTVWGIGRVLGQYVPGLRIKAPNDLLVDRYKLGGILTETRCQGGQIRSAVIGVGINGWNAVPEGAINLKDLNSPIVDLEELRNLVIRGIMQGKAQWEQGDQAKLVRDYHNLTKSNPHLGYPS